MNDLCGPRNEVTYICCLEFVLSLNVVYFADPTTKELFEDMIVVICRYEVARDFVNMILLYDYLHLNTIVLLSSNCGNWS